MCNLGPPSPPTLRLASVDSTIITLSCHLEDAGSPAADVTWFMNNIKMPSGQSETVSDKDGELTSYLQVSVTDTAVNEFICQASNDVNSEKLVDTFQFINDVTSTTTTTTTTATTSVSRSSSASFIIPVSAASRVQHSLSISENDAINLHDDINEITEKDIHDIPVADMPVKQSSDYDYSHFEYLNENFDATYKDTLKYAEQFEYDYEDYEEYGEPSQTEKVENSVLIKQLKEQFTNSSSSNIHVSDKFLLLLIYILTKCFQS